MHPLGVLSHTPPDCPSAWGLDGGPLDSPSVWATVILLWLRLLALAGES